MKKALLALLLLLPAFAIAQNDDVVRSVCGVRFGSTYSQCRQKLIDNFGKDPFIDNDDEMLFSFVEVNGYEYDFVTFTFVYKNGQRLLDKVELEIVCETKYEANQKRDEMQRQWARYYKLDRFTNNDGSPYWGGGTSPLNKNDYGFLIMTDESGLESYPWKACVMFGLKNGFGYGNR